MLISIHDQTLQRVGFLSNENPLTPDFKNDKFHRYLAQGAATFDFTVNKRKNGVLQDYMQHLNEHAYFSFQYEGEDFLFDSVIVEENDDEVTFNCLTLNLEMRNEEVKKLENSTSHNIQWYFDKMGLINFAQIKLGKNEVSDSTRVIKYDSEDTKLSRLISVIQNFDAEFEFVTTLKRDGSLDNITLNLYKKNDGADIQGVGQNRNDVILTFGENVTGVSRKVDKSQIFNGLYVTGKDGLSWKDKAWSVKNAEGVEEFYKRAGESYAKAPLSAQMFPAQIQSTKGDIWTIRNKETEYTSPEAMWGYALSELRKNAYPLVEYEVQATSGVTVSSMGDGTPLHIGDTVRIQDMNFMDSNGDVGLFLSARVSELEISFTNPTNNKITFSNYVKLKSEVSDDLLDRMQSIIDQNTPYRSEIMTTNGIQFKNGTGTTDLSAHIFKGANIVETKADNYSWYKDGVLVAETQEITVNAADVPEKAVYSYQAQINGDVVATSSVTITNVNDGTEGKPGEDGKPGKDGVGIKATTVTYAKSTSGTTQPTTGWTSTVPTVPAGQFLWTKTVWDYTDSTSETGYSVSKMGNDGKPGEDGQDGQDGESSWNILFEKDSYVLPANSLGAVTSYEGTGTSLKVVLGNGTLLTPVSNATVPKEPGTFTMKPTVHENISSGAGNVDTENKAITYSAVSKMDSNSDTASITYTIWVNVGGVVTTLVKVQRFSKSQKGLTGDPGADSHSYFMYSANADGSKMVSQPDADTKYIGVCSTSATTAPTNPSSYTWSKYVGQDALNPVGDNLVANPNFDGLKIDDTLYLPTLYFKDHYQWQAYQDIPKLVAPESDSPSSMIIRCDVTNRTEASTAALSPFIPVKPGERYIIGADIRWTGNGTPSDQYNLNLRFFPTTINTDKRMTTGQTGNNGFGFIGKKGNNTIQTSDKPSINRWNACWAIVEIPDDGTGYISPAWYSNDKKFVIDYRNVYVKRVEKASISKLDSEPLGKYPGQIWQYTGTSPITVGGVAIQPNTQYIWNGTKWELYAIYSNNMVIQNGFITNAMIANAAIDFAKINSATIENLSAVNSILGDVKAGKITNEFEYDSSVGKTKGTLVIDEIGLRMDYIENDDETRPGSLQVSPSGMTVSRYNTEGLRETASYTQKGMVMSSDVLPMKLSWQGITATVNYERSFDVVYITGRGNWGKFEANKERSFTGLPESVWPQYEIASGASSMGGAQNMAAKITTDGRIGITSSVSKDNCYAGFSITYRARPNVS
ncbi:phage tail protein [Lactococcus formosensis]|uniref:phage tail protein n=1 Tax=Lactococcus formosensis TaxID=1281486 RepID=UPI00288D36CA|nr:hypothetical protein [Lactococcus formosensis]MDT2725931.1 hypothetical protein [Lactococcus formosensis]